MISSDSQPIQFWPYPDETFNEETVCGLVRQDCFCQIFQTDDEIVLQFKEDDGDVGLVTVKAIDQDGNTVGGLQLTNLSGYQTITFTPSELGMVSGGKYYLTIENQGSLNMDTLEYLVTMSNVTLSIQHTMAIDTGSYALTVNDAGLNVQYKLQITTASFIVTANNIGLTGPLQASASPDSISGSETSSTDVSVTSDPTTCYPLGGESPYAYDWEYVSGSVTISADSDTSATTTFTDPAVNCGNIPVEAVWRCKVTDNLSTIVYTNNVTISLVNTETTCA